MAFLHPFSDQTSVILPDNWQYIQFPCRYNFQNLAIGGYQLGIRSTTTKLISSTFKLLTIFRLFVGYPWCTSAVHSWSWCIQDFPSLRNPESFHHWVQRQSAGRIVGCCCLPFNHCSNSTLVVEEILANGDRPRSTHCREFHDLVKIYFNN